MKRTTKIITLIALITLSIIAHSHSLAADLDIKTIDAQIAPIATFDNAAAQLAMAPIENLIRQTQNQPELRNYLRQQLSALLTRDITPQGQMFVCRQLWFLGATDALTPLAEMLKNETTVDIACYALAKDTSPKIGELLRNSLSQLKGRSLIAVINLLGERRDPIAAEPIAKFVADADPNVAQAAMTALGKIGGDIAKQTLVKATQQNDPALKTAATHAYLQYAQSLQTLGNNSEALAIFESLNTDQQPAWVRTAALRGMTAAGPENKKTTDAVFAALKENDLALQRAALGCLRMLNSDNVIKTLITNLNSCPPQTQALLIPILADKENADSLPIITEMTRNPDPDVKLAALTALAKIGNASSTPMLINTATKGDSDNEKVAAQIALQSIRDKNTDTAIIESLTHAEPASQVILINILADRAAATAVPALMSLTASPDPAVARAAFKALGRLADGKDAPALIELLVNLKNEKARAAAERAVIQISLKAGKGSQKSQPVVDAYQKASDIPLRCSLLRVLGGIATNQARETLYAAIKNDNTDIRDTAVRELTNWSDPEVIDVLLDIYKTSDNKTHHVLALRGFLRLIELPSKMTVEQKLDTYNQALTLTNDLEEKKSIIAGLASVHHPKTLPLLMPFLNDDAVQKETVLAILKVVSRIRVACPAEAQKSLEQLIAVLKDEELKKEAMIPLEKIKNQLGIFDFDKIPAVSLFDGKTLTGWQALTPDLFRVEDGAIVAGSPDKKIPHNEFICSEKQFADFELTLQVKLTGDLAYANAGIQIRSKRVPDSFEMCGYQADMGQNQWACLYDESRRSRILAQPDPAELAKVLKPGDWNDYKIRCHNRRIQLWINGSQTVDYVEADDNIPQIGFIGLQIHAGPPAQAWYRNIQIKIAE